MTNIRVERVFRAQFDVKGSKRTIEGRAVPYGIAEEVSDNGIDWYPEEWAYGAFSGATVPAVRGRVKLNYTHDDTLLRNWIGKTLHLEEKSDGLYGEWKVDDTEVGDLALYKAADGQLPGLSVAARFVDSVNREGVTIRVRAMLDHVALCEQAAFSSAQVLAVRSQQGIRPAEWGARLDQLRQTRTRILG